MNAAKSDSPKNLSDELPSPAQILLQRAEQTPEQPYLHQPVDGQWRTYTWAEVAEQSRRMAAALVALGLPKGSRVLLTGTNTAHWFMADFACGLAGMVGVGLYPKQSDESVTFIAKHSAAQAAFIGPMPDADSFIGALPKNVVKIALPYPGVVACEHDWDTLAAAHQPLAKPVSRKPDDLWTLIYTSGTTGNPKGVIVTQRNLTFCAAGSLRAMPAAKGGEHFISYLPLAHAFERGAVELCSLYLPAQIYFVENLEKLPSTILRVRPTRFFAVPLVWARFQSAILKKLPAPKLNLLLMIPLLSGFIKRKLRKGLGFDRCWLRISGAAPMPLPVIEWFDKIGLEVFQGYGMTENSIYATVNLPGRNRVGSVGKPHPDSEIRIAKDGEIQNRHPGITPGYYHDEEKTRELFTKDGWLRTGDVGRLDEDGYLYITGRVKEIFKTLKGKYVTPSPIEGGFGSVSELDQVCLVGSGLQQPILIASLSAEGRNADKAAVENVLLKTMETVNAQFEAHEAIAKIIIVKDAWTVDNNLVTPTMKVRRNEVEKRYSELIQKNADDRKKKIVWES